MDRVAVNFCTAAAVDHLCAFIAPWRCLLCAGRATGMDLCAACLADLPWLGKCCSGCAMPLAQGDRCGRCCVEPPASSTCVAALSYEYPVANLIAALKYKGHIANARVLAELLAMRVNRHPSGLLPAWPALLLPVPLHPRRQAERGCNQAELLARWLGRTLQLPFSGATVERVRDTPPQVALSRAGRRRNMRNAFVVRRNVSGLSLALVDDVMTTGATVQELARSLLCAGAAEVQVWVVARAAR